MKTNKSRKASLIILTLLSCLFSVSVIALPRLAVLDFELKDLTYIPGIAQEIDRTASVKPMLEAELTKSGYQIISIPLTAQLAATAGRGYLFDHHDIVAQLAKKYGVDYVLVGRLHKPSFLFVYLMVHLVDVEQQTLVADYTSEVKGGEKKLTFKGVESLVVKINNTFSHLQ